jgi:phytoene desaturase
MTAATHLARQGLEVTLYEKNNNPGGRCDRIIKRGHCFDTGPTLLVMPLVVESEFASLGASMHGLLDLQQVDPSYHLIFDDNSTIELTTDKLQMKEQLERIEPGSFDGYLRYMEEGRRHYDLGIEKLVYRDFRKATDFFNPKNIPLLYQVKPFTKHYSNMSNYFDHPRLMSAFTFQDVYMGLSPFEAPATFSLMQYTEMAHGVWYPKGGMYSIVEALFKLAQQAGVEFQIDVEVDEIITKESRAVGVALEDGRIHEADAIIANCDLPYVYQKLLPPDGTFEKLSSKRYSCSTISFFWGVDKQYLELPPHTLFLADDYRANFDSIMQDLTIPENPSLYIHAPARLDASMAPPGEDTIIGVVPVGHLDGNGKQDWRDLRRKAREAVFNRLSRLGINDFEEHIKFEVNYTPLSWRQRYYLVKGATHGLGHNVMQLAYMRPHNRHARYRNLYFTGASTHPGTGIPTVLVSGRHTATRLLDDYDLPVPQRYT